MRKKGDEFYLNLIVVYIYTIVNIYTYAAAKSLQLCPTLCNPLDSSPPGSPVPGILQARTLEWVAIAFSDIHIYVYMCVCVCVCEIYINICMI